MTNKAYPHKEETPPQLDILTPQKEQIREQTFSFSGYKFWIFRFFHHICILTSIKH